MGGVGGRGTASVNNLKMEVEGFMRVSPPPRADFMVGTPPPSRDDKSRSFGKQDGPSKHGKNEAITNIH